MNSRGHIAAIDLIRAAACAAVVAVHAVGMISFPTQAGHLAAGAATSFFHFTREAFMVVTGLVLFSRPHDTLDVLPFWGRRLLDRVFPYVFWTLIYVLIYLGVPGDPLWSKKVVSDLWLGNASYQLYYMVLTFQFYLVFPLLWLLLRRIPRHQTWILLGVLTEQIVWYAYLGPVSLHPQGASWPWGAAQVSRFLLTYPFFFVLGAWAGLNLEKILGVLRRHSRLAITLSVLAIALMEGRYLYTALVLKDFRAAVNVLQPSMIFDSVAMVLLLFMAGTALFERFEGLGGRLLRRIVLGVSEASFGIFFAHVIFLRAFSKSVLPHWHASPLIHALGLWLFAFGGSYLLTRLLMAIPGTAILVGHWGRGGLLAVRRPKNVTP